MSFEIWLLVPLHNLERAAREYRQPTTAFCLPPHVLLPCFCGLAGAKRLGSPWGAQGPLSGPLGDPRAPTGPWGPLGLQGPLNPNGRCYVPLPLAHERVGIAGFKFCARQILKFQTLGSTATLAHPKTRTLGSTTRLHYPKSGTLWHQAPKMSIAPVHASLGAQKARTLQTKTSLDGELPASCETSSFLK